MEGESSVAFSLLHHTHILLKVLLFLAIQAKIQGVWLCNVQISALRSTIFSSVTLIGHVS